MVKNIIIDQNPAAPIFPKVMDQGNKKIISKSKIMNNIETR